MKKMTYLLILFLLFWSSLLRASDISVILDGYAQNQDQVKSYVIKLETDTTFNAKSSNPRYAPYNGSWKEYTMQELRTDGDRYYLKGWRWGDDMRKGVDVVKDDARYNSRLYNGDKAYQNNYSTFFPKKPDSLIVYPGGNKTLQEDTLCRGIKCHSAFGYFEGDLNTRIDKLLEDSDIEMQAQNEIVNGYSCRVITADTSNGKYKLWFAPENGYSIVKATKAEKGGDIHCGSPNPKGLSGFRVLEVYKMIEVNGVWIPTEIRLKGKTTFANGDFSQIECACKINTLNLNPDHELLKSFEIDDIRDGANTMVYGVDNIQYIWQGGELIPNIDKVTMDTIDEEVEKLLNEKISTKSKPYAIIKEPNELALKRKPESLTPPMSMTISELLTKYQASQNRLRSFIAKGESTLEIAGKSGETSRMEKTASEFRCAGSRVNYRVGSLNDEISPCKVCYESFVWDGKSFIEYQQNSDPDKSRAFVSRYDSDKNKRIAKEYKGAVLMGVCGCDYERIDLILSKARSISLHDKTDTIGGSECYVIEANTKRGKYKVWIDPDHGYNIARIEVQRNKRNLINYMEPLKAKMSFSLKNVRFEKIDDVWVPMEANIQQTEDNGNKITRWHHKRIEFVLNPDHNTLKSFVPDDIPDGTMVKLAGDSKKYEWRKGRPVASVAPRRLRRILPSQKDKTCVW